MKFVYSTLLIFFLTLSANSSIAQEEPSAVLETKVNQLIEEFLAERAHFEENKKSLFSMVDRVIGPIFDFNYISKLVMGKNWKKATDAEKKAFAVEFKRLMLVTYASALFKFTGQEAITFIDTKIKERQGVLLASVNSEVTLSEGKNISVVYSMINNGNGWTIYNLTVGTLNMALSYRNVIQSMIHNKGIAGTIQSLKDNNDKNSV